MTKAGIKDAEPQYGSIGKLLDAEHHLTETKARLYATEILVRLADMHDQGLIYNGL